MAKRKITRPYPVRAPKKDPPFIPPEHPACQALREAMGVADKKFASVYRTVGQVRYCYCGYCGERFKATPRK